jgi:hypothetical protein
MGLIKVILGGLAVYQILEGWVRKIKSHNSEDDDVEPIDPSTNPHEFHQAYSYSWKEENKTLIFRILSEFMEFHEREIDGWADADWHQWQDFKAKHPTKLIHSGTMKPILAEIEDRIKKLEETYSQSSEELTLLERLERIEQKQNEFESRLTALEGRFKT